MKQVKNNLNKYILGYVKELGIKRPVLIDSEKTDAYIDTHNGNYIVMYNTIHFFPLTDETRASDRLTDLIDAGDLVYNKKTESIRMVVAKDKDSVYVESFKNKDCHDVMSVDTDCIGRVYKPDEKGNYILVYNAD